MALLTEAIEISANGLDPEAPTSAPASSDPSGQVRHSHEVPAFPVPWKHPIRAIGWCLRMAFGLASLAVLLAVIAAIPILNFLALGYLLEVEGALARTGRFRNAFPLLAEAPRLGTLAVGIWLFLIPLRVLSDMAADAHLIAPGGSPDVWLHRLLLVSWALITVHLCLAVARGGTAGCFVRPLKNLRWLMGHLRAGDYLSLASEQTGNFIRRLHLRHHFWLGVRGFGVAFTWLFVPSLCFAVSRNATAGSVIMTLIGGCLLAVVLSWAPFLQARFVVESRFSAGFELRKVRVLFRHAPIAWTLAITVLYLLALPLYLFKIAPLPPEAMWLSTLIFIVSIYPTRVLTGWAYHRAARRQENGRTAHWSVRWLCGGVQIAELLVFVFVLNFTPFIGAEGRAVLFQHHALLLPSPF